MQIFFSLVTALVLSFGTQVFGSETAKVISSQTFQAKIRPQNLRCTDGHPGNFPIPLELSMETYYGSDAIRANTLLLQNVDRVSFRGQATELCADYAKLLGQTGEILVTGTKTNTERAFLRTDNGLCQRTITEKLSLRLESGLTLTGQTSFIIFPAPAEECQK